MPNEEITVIVKEEPALTVEMGIQGPQGNQGETGEAGDGDVNGPPAANTDDLAIFDGTTGKLLKDSNISIGNIGDVKGPETAINSNIVLFDSTTGKLLKDSLKNTGQFLESIIEDLTPQLGGDLDVNAKKIMVRDHGSASSPETVNVVYGTGTAPSAASCPIGTLFIKYTI